MAEAAGNGDAPAPSANGHHDDHEHHEMRAVEQDPSKRYTRVSSSSCKQEVSPRGLCASMAQG
jgi:hypothetical protein